MADAHLTSEQGVTVDVGPARRQPRRNLANLVEDGRVHRDVYVDPGVFEAEMCQIFGRTWVYVGHESEIPSPGSYKTTAIGTEPVILVRGRDEVVRVLMNRCSHRGATVCQVAKGTGNAFRCEYHGWTFATDGTLLGVPYADGYSDIDRTTMGLHAVARVENYRGFVFASLYPDVTPLAQHLAGVLGHIDRFVDHAGDYDIQVAPDANEALYHGNWKLQLENSVDGYHLSFTHQSVFAVMQHRTGKRARYLTASSEGDGAGEAFGSGHTVMDLRALAPDVLRNRLETLPGAPVPGTDLDAYFGTAGGEALYMASTGPAMNITVFPNLQLGSINICEVHPLAVDRTRVVLRPLLLAGAPDPVNRLRLRYHELGSGPAGFVQPDDLEMFERIQAGLTTSSVEWLRMDRGAHRETTRGSHHRVGHITDEAPQRGQYRWWRTLMGSPA